MAEKVSIALMTGHRMEVQARVTGDFAVHPAVKDGMPTCSRWTVTHVPSGLSVWRTKTEEEADACVAWLAKNNPLPHSKKKCLEWASSPEASKLYLELQAIASYKEF